MSYLDKHLEIERIKTRSRNFIAKMILRVVLIGVLFLISFFTCQSYREWRYIPDNMGYMLEPGEMAQYREENIKDMKTLLNHEKDSTLSTIEEDILQEHSLTYSSTLLKNAEDIIWKRFLWEQCVKERVCQFTDKDCNYPYEVKYIQNELLEIFKRDCKIKFKVPNYVFLSDKDKLARIDSLSDKKLVKRCYVKEKYGTMDQTYRASHYYPFWLFFWE